MATIGVNGKPRRSSSSISDRSCAYLIKLTQRPTTILLWQSPEEPLRSKGRREGEGGEGEVDGEAAAAGEASRPTQGSQRMTSRETCLMDPSPTFDLTTLPLSPFPATILISALLPYPGQHLESHPELAVSSLKKGSDCPAEEGSRRTPCEVAQGGRTAKEGETRRRCKKLQTRRC
jgi:hypothetical protein